MFIGRTDAEAETPILWPPDAKSWLIWKDPDAGKDWGREETGTTEDEMVGWHHQLNGHGFGWTPGVDDGQGGLAYWGSWGRKESDTTERLNWTEIYAYCFCFCILNHIRGKWLTNKKCNNIGSVFTYVVIFTGVLYFLIWLQVTVQHPFLSTWRTPVGISHRPGLQVAHVRTWRCEPAWECLGRHLAVVALEAKIRVKVHHRTTFWAGFRELSFFFPSFRLWTRGQGLYIWVLLLSLTSHLTVDNVILFGRFPLTVSGVFWIKVVKLFL